VLHPSSTFLLYVINNIQTAALRSR
uniref:Uncharacterized protein n=1 Tax=Anopheles funestus TaxID=62324 RepID=A0A182S4A7_ANOFN